MLDTRLGRLLGFLVGIGLLVVAVVIYRSHRMDEKKIEVVQYDPEAARQVYEERIEQTKAILSGLGSK